MEKTHLVCTDMANTDLVCTDMANTDLVCIDMANTDLVLTVGRDAASSLNVSSSVTTGEAVLKM